MTLLQKLALCIGQVHAETKKAANWNATGGTRRKYHFSDFTILLSQYTKTSFATDFTDYTDFLQ